MDIPYKLKQLRLKLGLTQKQLALKLEVGSTTIAEIEQGIRPLNSKVTLALLRVFNYDIEKDVYLSENNLVPNDFIKIPFYRISVAAGSGIYLEENIEKDTLNFDKKVLEHILPTHVNFKYLICLTAVGDSMTTPDGKGIKNNDLLFVDTSKKIVDNGVYVILVNNELRVKRLIKKLDGSLSIQSDNPKYETEIYNVETSPYTVGIMGKVLFNMSRGEI